jgi:hypothetical protein
VVIGGVACQVFVLEYTRPKSDSITGDTIWEYWTILPIDIQYISILVVDLGYFLLDKVLHRRRLVKETRPTWFKTRDGCKWDKLSKMSFEGGRRFLTCSAASSNNEWHQL